GQEATASGLRAHRAQRDRLGRLAVRVARAGPDFAEPAALHLHRRTAGLAHLVGRRLGDDLDGAVGALEELLGVLALRVPRAGEERTVPPPLDDHRRAALLADVLGR